MTIFAVILIRLSLLYVYVEMYVYKPSRMKFSRLWYTCLQASNWCKALFFIFFFYLVFVKHAMQLKAYIVERKTLMKNYPRSFEGCLVATAAVAWHWRHACLCLNFQCCFHLIFEQLLLYLSRFLCYPKKKVFVFWKKNSMEREIGRRKKIPKFLVVIFYKSWIRREYNVLKMFSTALSKKQLFCL